ncbi:MAG: GDSL-type esterase/lipase family protein, partial [Verrucomicrobiota bacterium]|nr:GDSL-type esterase/lipase family protein [Verrucomicrobiota bacterium]
MKKSLSLCSAVLSLSALCLSGQTPPPLRIMPLGDSITYGANNDGIGGGYRYPLYVALTNAGYNVDYVGTQTSIPHAGLGAEINHEGHSGWKIVGGGGNNLYDNVLSWFSAIADPDVILVHIGTNDSGDGDYNTRINDLDNLITRMAVARPYAHIIVTTLLKRANPNYTNITNHFNPFVEGKVLAQQALGRRVHFLDMHAYLELSDMYDNLHPNNAGYGKMAAAWFPAITNIAGAHGDHLPPGLSSVKPASAASLAVTFSKPVALAASPAVTNPASYTLAPAGTVTAVSALSADLRSVTLTLAGLTPNVTATVTFNGAVTDLVPAEEGGPFTAALSASRTFTTPAASGFAADNVPPALLAGWEPLYTLNIPAAVRYGRDPVDYALNNAAAYAGVPLARVAYYLALQRLDEPLRYVWAEADAFTQDAAKLGVPTIASGAFFQQAVSNLTVATSSPAVTPGAFPAGNIEFWPGNYSQDNTPAVPGASAALYDFGDRATSGNYGSMQLHNTALGQTLFAFNHWGLDSTAAAFVPCLGIGNSAGSAGHPESRDWTFDENAASYPTRVLQVFVKRAPAAPPHPLPALLSAHTGYAGNLIQA